MKYGTRYFQIFGPTFLQTFFVRINFFLFLRFFFLQISLANTSIEVSRDNLRRFSQILFPPPPAVLNKMCQQVS